MIAIDLIKQQALDADPKAIQQINFTVNLDRAASFFLIIEEAKELSEYLLLISAFAYLVGIPVGIVSSVVELKTCAITAGIKRYNTTKCYFIVGG